MKEQLRQFFRIPCEIKDAFWEDAVRKNRVTLLLVSIMIFGMELFNMGRVLFMTESRLGTANNRRYFFMYLTLFLGAALLLAFQRLFRRTRVRARWCIHYGFTLFFFFWHIALNAYDLSRDPEGNTGVYTTAMLGMAILIQMPPVFAFLAHGLGYALFTLLTVPEIPSGHLLNLTITAIVALAISLTRSHQAVIVLSQQQEIQEMNRSLQALLQKDPLTGLLNKTAFQDTAESALKKLPPDGKFTLLLMDMDDFKGINDRYGHPCGDMVLKEAAWALRDAFPSSVAIGRIGGDEFAVALRHSGEDGCEAAFRRLLEDLKKIRWKGEVLDVSASTGVCRAATPGKPFSVLYQEADRALYRAKAQGKGNCCTQELP